MKIEVLNPYFLILIPIFLFLIFSIFRKLKMNKIKKTVILVLRSIIIIFIILCLCNLSLVWKAKDNTTIFVVDNSDSMNENKELIEDFIEKAINNKTSKDYVGIISFGDNAVVNNFVNKNIIFSGFDTKINSNYTNIENALIKSLSMFRENTKKRLVLITDGKENIGTSSKLIPTLKTQGITLQVYKLNNDMKEEAAVDELDVPQNIRQGQKINITVNIKSTVNTNCKVTLYSGNTKKAEQYVKLISGDNRFIFKDTAESGGFKTYKISIEPSIDTIKYNNEAAAFTNVLDKPRILVIKDKEGEETNIINILKSSNINYHVVNAGGEPDSLKGLSQYKSIITCNVSSENLNKGFLQALPLFVKELGGGFIALGGDNSFALGGYSKTSLEEVLPVYMDMRGKKEIPKISLMLVIDKSGSMQGDKVELAKEAAARTVDFLSAKDEIGVLAFDSSQYWVVNRQNVIDKNSIKDTIATIGGGGGTSILPALETAYNSLKKSDAKIKHIILITDGQAESLGYDFLLKNINKNNITVSTVAVGNDSDTYLLNHIAKEAKGRFYYTDEFTNIPRIFAKETFMVSKTYINNEKFTPVIQNNHLVIKNVYEAGLPQLLGYIGATPKNTAEVVLKSNEDDPILTLWQYGLGKTAAWNSDLNGKWSKNYINWDKNIDLWQNIINWTIENYNDSNLFVETNQEGINGIIKVINKNIDESLQTEAEIISPSNKKISKNLNGVSPKEYTGSFELKEKGAYIIKIKQSKDGSLVNAATSGMIVQYSPEYRIEDNTSSLDALVNEADGVNIKSPGEVFKGKLYDVEGKRNITDILVIICLILFILDIAVRKFDFSSNIINDKINNKVESKKINSHQVIENNKAKEDKHTSKKFKILKKEKKENLNTAELLKNKKNKNK